MSQKKVDAYKAEKASRKETVKSNQRKKRMRSLGVKIAGMAVALAIVVALVITGVNTYKSYKNGLPTYGVETFSVSDYSGILSTTEAESEHDDHDHDSDDAEDDETKD